jgi:hypothetical protein
LQPPQRGDDTGAAGLVGFAQTLRDDIPAQLRQHEIIEVHCRFLSSKAGRTR